MLKPVVAAAVLAIAMVAGGAHADPVVRYFPPPGAFPTPPPRPVTHANTIWRSYVPAQVIDVRKALAAGTQASGATVVEPASKPGDAPVLTEVAPIDGAALTDIDATTTSTAAPAPPAAVATSSSAPATTTAESEAVGPDDAPPPPDSGLAPTAAIAAPAVTPPPASPPPAAVQPPAPATVAVAEAPAPPAATATTAPSETPANPWMTIVLVLIVFAVVAFGLFSWRRSVRG